MANDRADLVVVGAGTVGGWASYFAATQGAERVVAIERGRTGIGASSRAAGIVRRRRSVPCAVGPQPSLLAGGRLVNAYDAVATVNS